MNEQPEKTPDPDEDRRRQLRERGWHQAAGTLFQRLMWKSPGGRIMSEPEAFAELAVAQAREAKEKSDG
jgi:hypothetical protein